MVLYSSDLDEVLTLASRVLVMYGGTLVEDLAKVEIEAMAVIQGDAGAHEQPSPEAPASNGEAK